MINLRHLNAIQLGDGNGTHMRAIIFYTNNNSFFLCHNTEKEAKSNLQKLQNLLAEKRDKDKHN